jgi:hypothetical protein
VPEFVTDPAREELHRLLDRIPPGEVAAARSFQQFLADPVAQALRKAPLDDEPESPEERAAVDAALADPAADLPFQQVRRRK